MQQKNWLARCGLDQFFVPSKLFPRSLDVSILRSTQSTTLLGDEDPSSHNVHTNEPKEPKNEPTNDPIHKKK